MKARKLIGFRRVIVKITHLFMYVTRYLAKRWENNIFQMLSEGDLGKNPGSATHIFKTNFCLKVHNVHLKLAWSISE